MCTFSLEPANFGGPALGFLCRAGTGSASSTTAYQGGSTVQVFINQNGQLQTELVEYPLGSLLGGLTGNTQFPSGSLPLAIAHLDGVERISTLADWRPA